MPEKQGKLYRGPFSPPDWKFNRSVERSKYRSKVSGYGYDQDTRMMVSFLQAQKNYGTRDGNQLKHRHPLAFAAHEIFTHADPSVRILVEARLLAGQSDEEIANRECTFPEVIRFYESVFYNVRDRLENRDYIFRQIVDSSTAPGRHGLQLSELSAKYFAYFGGPVLLDFIITGDTGQSNPRNKEEIGEYLDRFLTGTIRRRATTAAMEISINRYNAVELIGMHYRLLELQAEAEQGLPQSQQKWQDNVTQFLAEVPWAFGEDGSPRRADGSTVINLLEAPVELRADQALRYGAGEMTEEEVKSLSEKKLPPPTKKALNSDD